jgi:hypothetical protein
MIYIERLRALAREQKLVLNELDLQARQPRKMSLDEELVYFRNKAQLLEDALKLAKSHQEVQPTVLSRVNSATVSLQSSLATSLDNTLITEESDDEILPPHLEYGGADDEQKLFYSECISIKLELSAHHNLESLPIYSMYCRAIAHNVPVKDWGQFIRAELMDRVEGQDDKAGRDLRRRFQYIKT